MNKEMYVEILANYFIPTARERYGNNWYLHQDNDPKHTSGLARSFLQFSNAIWVIKLLQSLINIARKNFKH